jgi:hypothetical protein
VSTVALRATALPHERLYRGTPAVVQVTPGKSHFAAVLFLLTAIRFTERLPPNRAAV